jgi:hypothetical protein
VDGKFEASLGYIVRPCLKQQKQIGHKFTKDLSICLWNRLLLCRLSPSPHTDSLGLMLPQTVLLYSSFPSSCTDSHHRVWTMSSVSLFMLSSWEPCILSGVQMNGMFFPPVRHTPLSSHSLCLSFLLGSHFSLTNTNESNHCSLNTPSTADPL